MRYRNLIIGSILGAIMGGIMGAIFGAFGDGILSPTTLALVFALACFGAFFGGMFGSLVGPIDYSDLTLVVENRHYRAGDKVDVRVSLHPKKSFYLRGGKVELVCVETLYESDEGGLHKRTHELWGSAVPFLHEQQIPEGRSYDGTFNFSIPDDARPSLKGEDFEFSWRVQVSVDIAGALDIHKNLELNVLPLVPQT